MAGLLRGSVLMAAAFGAFAAGEPAELHGPPLGNHTGLRLVVADRPPFVLDVDSGSVTRLNAVGNTFSVLGVASGAVVMVAGAGTRVTNLRVWVMSGKRASPRPIGAGRDVVPAAGGAGVWVTRVVRPRRCVLLRIALDGRQSASRAIPCKWVIAPAADLGLVVRRTRIIDPRTGRKVFGSRQGVLAVAGARVLVGMGTLHWPDYRFSLTDTVTGARHRFGWPSILKYLDIPQVDPQGRYIALPFADPAYRLSGSQVLDVWVLDTFTGKLTHLPSSPAYVSLKRTSIAWTHDSRLVLLGEVDERAFVGVWRPGQTRLALKTIHFPRRNGASDAFAPLG
ncbi:MAG TPA: hypothetical protein VFD90_14135 [Gaiellales bacterium]|jgi:hypothetical protein|nr:hypothetical protein [Gaiellales bacterium]